ncbi:MAG: hypothetical protein N2319_04625 [Candidatus Kapabacteria bacterium]|nr:hypothetical protein [Candidatus Kapabacteria bacterium]
MITSTQKQKEIEELLESAKSLQNEVNEITAKALEISDKFQQIGDNISQVFDSVGSIVSNKSVGKLATSIIKKSKYKEFSKAGGELINASTELAGTLISGIGDLLNVAISKYGQWKANKKREKSLKELLPKKQELAKAKKDKIQELLPKITNNKNKLLEFCKNEVKVEIDSCLLDRYEYIKGSAKDIFIAYHNMNFTEKLCNFMIEEFSFWLKGEHESNLKTPTLRNTLNEDIRILFQESNFPQTALNFSYLKSISIGSLLLLNDNDLKKPALQNKEIIKFLEEFGNLRYSSLINPFFKNKKQLDSFYENYLKENVVVNKIITFRKKKLKRKFIWAFVLIIIIVIAFLLLT